jgi:hypothetical protein
MESHWGKFRAGASGNLFGLAMLCGLWPLTLLGQLEVPAQRTPQAVFGGGARQVSVVFRNRSDQDAEADIRIRILQASSGTAAPLKQVPWKRLRMLGGQTVIESATLTIPTVRAETRLVCQWLEVNGRVLGKTDLFVYPEGLLKGLKPLLAGGPIGVWEPQDRLIGLLKGAAIEVMDLQNSGLEDFGGRLAIIGPFSAQAQMPSELAGRLKKLAQKGVSIVWLLPPDSPQKEPMLSAFQIYDAGPGTVLVAAADLTPDLVENPRSQLQLIRLAENALSPQPKPFPFLPE